MALRIAVVMDYQNVHLTAHSIFAPDREKWEALISPMGFARTAIRRRNKKQRPGFPRENSPPFTPSEDSRTLHTTQPSIAEPLPRHISGVRKGQSLRCGT